jgi:prepilin-type N-terminal cleavage/methylation domain-containing protein
MKFSKKGFTMVELLIVMIILAILVAVAAPMYFANTNRAKASEAVAALGIIRQAERDYRVNHNLYFDITTNGTTGNVQNPLPTSVVATTGVTTPGDAGAGVDLGVTQYFSNGAFSVDAVNQPAGQFTNPTSVEFIITANGANSFSCSGAGATNCAVKAGEVSNYQLQMDNSGRVYVSYDGGTTWGAY